METLRILWAPNEEFPRLLKAGGTRWAIGTVSLLAFLNLITTLINLNSGVLQLEQQYFPDVPRDVLQATQQAMKVLTPIAAATYPFIIWLVLGVLMYLIGRAFGGTGRLSSMLVVSGVSQLPLIVGLVAGSVLAAAASTTSPDSPAAAFLGSLSFSLLIGQFMWMAWLAVTGIRHVHQLDPRKSVASCGLSCLGCLGVFFILMFVAAIILSLVITTRVSS